MTSFAFILGCVPLWTASGAGAVGRRVLGTVVIGGMLTDTLIASLFISVSFYVSERFRRTSPHAATPVSAPATISGGAGDAPSPGGSRS
jgi:HAE1 family hydrophobic/amphiphilic exporter-1